NRDAALQRRWPADVCDPAPKELAEVAERTVQPQRRRGTETRRGCGSMGVAKRRARAGRTVKTNAAPRHLALVFTVRPARASRPAAQADPSNLVSSLCNSVSLWLRGEIRFLRLLRLLRGPVTIESVPWT